MEWSGVEWSGTFSVKSVFLLDVDGDSEDNDSIFVREKSATSSRTSARGGGRQRSPHDIENTRSSWLRKRFLQ